MDLSKKEKEIEKRALAFIKENKKALKEKYAGSDFDSAKKPYSIFMAGSPGAGKTEFSKNLIVKVVGETQKIIRIDIDDYRREFVDYDGGNAYVFQRPANKVANIIHDKALHDKKHCIFDGTFSSITQAKENIERSISKGRKIVICYVYMDPLLAWGFTQKREQKEGRRVMKDNFIKQYFDANKTVQFIKDTYHDDVEVWLIEKDLSEPPKIISFKVNITKLDRHIKIAYSESELRKKI